MQGQRAVSTSGFSTGTIQARHGSLSDKLILAKERTPAEVLVNSGASKGD